MRPAPRLPALLSCALLLPAALATAETEEEREKRIRDLEEKVELLTDELARTREEIGVPEEKPLESSWGLGPAASKVYGIGRGLSIGGYAEAFHSEVVADKRLSGQEDRFDFLRTVLYTGYKFTDWAVFNAEFEFEHASTSSTESSGGGSVSVEFATLDFLIRDEVNTRAGLMLVPMGFLNEMHEPPFYFGNRRPEVETVIIPSTFRENGAGLFGRVADMFEYKLYAITSPDAVGFGDAGLRGGRQSGNRSLAEDWSVVARLDFEPIPEILLGGSVLYGKSGHDQKFNVDVDADGVTDLVRRIPSSRLTLWEAHAQYQSRGLHLRGLVTMAHLDDAGQLTLALRPAAQGGTGDIGAAEVIAETMFGVYGEVAYELVQWVAPGSGWTAEPFFRFEHVDTQHTLPSGFNDNRARRFDVYTVGVSVKPIPNIVLKLDYRNRTARGAQLGDEVNVGFGLVF